MTYTFQSYIRTSPRKLKLVELRESLNAAQVGGLIAHALGEVDVFFVDNEEHGTIMEYKIKRIKRS